jgi:hypothetical protein
MDRSRRILHLASFGVGFLLIAGSTQSFANEHCQQLEALSQQYAGVELTFVQKQMKRRMVLWYSQNCPAQRSAERN